MIERRRRSKIGGEVRVDSEFWYYHTTTLQAMALVTIVGFPCCGKSTRAKQIKEYLEKRIADETEGPKLSVVLVDDDNSHVPRSTYDSMFLSFRTWIRIELTKKQVLRRNQVVRIFSPISHGISAQNQ